MSSSDIFIGETIGTAVLILLGGGVCAAVTLKRSKARNAGWLAITFGWGFAVLTGAYIAAPLSGAHLNPAVTLGARHQGRHEWSNVPLYLAGQLLGAMIGAVLVWVAYYGQFQAHLTDREIVGGPAAEDGLVDRGGRPEGRPGARHLLHRPRDPATPCRTWSPRSSAPFVLVLAILTQGLNDEGNGLGVARRPDHRARRRRHRPLARRPDRLRDQPGP